MIKATHKPEAWRKERNFFLLFGLNAFHQVQVFISPKLFSVKLGKVLFPRRITQEQTSKCEGGEKHAPEPNCRESFRMDPPMIKGSPLPQERYSPKLT